MDFAFRAQQVLVTLILQVLILNSFHRASSPSYPPMCLPFQSAALDDAFGEMERLGVEDVIISVTNEPDTGCLTISGSGPAGSCEVTLPHSAENLFEQYQCEAPVRNTYHLSLMKPCLDALSVRVLLPSSLFGFFPDITSSGKPQDLCESEQ